MSAFAPVKFEAAVKPQLPAPAAANAASLNLPQSCTRCPLQFEAAVDPNRLHPLFPARPPLVRGAWLPTGALLGLWAVGWMQAQILCTVLALLGGRALLRHANLPTRPPAHSHPPTIWSPLASHAAHEVADAISLAELPEAPDAAVPAGTGGTTGEGSPGGAATGGGAEGAAGEGAAAGEQQPAAEQQQEQEGPQQEEEQQEAEEQEAEEEPLAWLPATLAAISLRLRALDAALLYGDPPQAAAREALPGYLFIQRPAERGVVSGQPLGEPLIMTVLATWLSGWN